MRSPLAFLRRFAIALFALACVASGNYTVRPGVPTPPAVIAMAAEHEAELRADAAPTAIIVVRRRARQPFKWFSPPVVHGAPVGAASTPRAPPAHSVEARGPPTRV